MPTTQSDYTAAHRKAKERTEAVTVSEGSSELGAGVDFRNALHERQRPALKLVRDVFGGTDSLREEASRYLPQHVMEGSDEYAQRKKRAVLFNAYKRTVQAMVGMVFRRDPILDDDVPARIAQHAENIDLQGRALTVFARDAFEDAMIAGHTFVLVDAPTVSNQREVRGTLADVNRSGRRPYWVHVKKDDVINVRWVFEAGEPVLELAVICEPAVVPSGPFGEEEVVRYRELRPGMFKLWRKEGNEFQLEAEGETSVERIPLVPIYTNRTGFFESAPPLLDLAHENVEHYQVRSDHRHALTFASIPIPVFTGLNAEDMEWGAGRSIFLPHPESSAQMLESGGGAIGESRKELKDIEARMAALGLSMLVRETRAAETAEAKAIDKAESDSQLIAMAKALQDGLMNAVNLHAEYLGEESGGTITVNDDFESMSISPDQARLLLEAVEKSVLSRHTYWLELERGGLLRSGFDAEEEAERLAREAGAEIEMLAEAMREDITEAA